MSLVQAHPQRDNILGKLKKRVCAYVLTPELGQRCQNQRFTLVWEWCIPRSTTGFVDEKN